jgi:hypothetical protein
MKALTNLIAHKRDKHVDSSSPDELDIHIKRNTVTISSTVIAAEEPSDSCISWDWRADASRSPLMQDERNLESPPFSTKKKDYYAGSAEIATETSLTVTRLEPVSIPLHQKHSVLCSTHTI